MLSHMKKPPIHPELVKHRQVILDQILSGQLSYDEIVHRALAFDLVNEVCGIFDWNQEDFYKQMQPKKSDCRGCKRNRGA